MMLNSLPSFYVTADLLKNACMDWVAISDEEIELVDNVQHRSSTKERLRAGGSMFKMKNGQKNKIKMQGDTSIDLEKGNQQNRKKTKAKTFARLKTKLSKMSNGKFSMFHHTKKPIPEKKISTDKKASEKYDNSENIPLLQSSKTLKQGRSLAFKSDAKLHNRKSLLIPDLNLKPVVGDHQERNKSVNMFREHVVERSKNCEEKKQKVADPSDENIHRLGSQYETALNYSASMTTDHIDKFRSKKHLNYKMIELTKVPPAYWKWDDCETVESKHRNTNSMPLFPGKQLENGKEKPRGIKTACFLSNQKETEIPVINRNKIASKYDASMYDFKRQTSKLAYSNLAKSSKISTRMKQTKSSDDHGNAQGYNAISGGLGDEMDCPEYQASSRNQQYADLSHVSMDIDQHPDQSRGSVKYIYKNRIGQGDQPSMRSWLERIASNDSDASETCLLPHPKGLPTRLDMIPLCDNKLLEKPEQRFYVLLMFCAVTCMQVIVSNTWNSIADSVLFAFPYCKPKSIALLSNWGSLSLLFCILPVCYMLHKKGLRTSILVACGLCTLGAGIRCLPLGPKNFILLAHIGSILNAMGGVTYGPAVVMLSSTWFPADERTFATGVGTSLSLLGSAATYFLGPLMVSDPTTFSINSDYVRHLIQDEIFFYMRLCFMAELCLFTLLVLCFPDKPEHPTSKASSISLSLNLSCLESVKLLIKNRPVTLLSISAALLSGAASPWLSLLTMILTELNISQSVAANIGFWTMICGCILGLVVSKLSDRFPGYIKQNLVTFASLSTVMFLWIALMIDHVLPFSQGKLLTAVLVGISSSWATSALFYELGAEIAYPVPESIVAGFMSSVSSLAVATVNAYVYFFSFIDISWLNYALVLFSLCSVLTLLFVNAVYNRSKLDR